MCCASGELCPFAHGSAQLRVEAGVALGKLPPDFKCHLCPAWFCRKTCPHEDRCHKAHGVQELRCGHTLLRQSQMKGRA